MKYVIEVDQKTNDLVQTVLANLDATPDLDHTFTEAEVVKYALIVLETIGDLPSFFSVSIVIMLSSAAFFKDIYVDD